MEAEQLVDEQLHSAGQGLIGETANGELYGITCEHATIASNGFIYMDFGDGTKTLVGVLANRKNQRSGRDVDFFQLNENFIAYFKQNNNKFEECNIYTGKIHELHERQVFRVSEKMGKITGRVVSGTEHDICGKDDRIDIGNNFLVIPDNDNNTENELDGFAVKGNSGDYVAIEIDGVNYIVGMITAGDYIPQHRKGKRPYTICLFIRSALNALRKTFKTIYSSSMTLLFKLPEKINPHAFDLSEQLINLTNMKFPEGDISKLQDQMRYEKSLSALIDSRSEIKSGIFPEDDPVQACVKNSVLACSHLWSKNLKKTEKCLKDAVLAMPKTDQMMLQMLCKVITYVAWYYRTAEEPNETRNLLLEEGHEFVKEMKTNSTFPRSSEFYIYFEYTMFYFEMGDVENATKFSLQAIDHSQDSLKDNPGSISSRNRLVLSVCQYADIKLRCGEQFENKDIDVDPCVVDDVEHRLASVHDITSDPTAKSYYLLKMADLYFRKKDYNSALEFATQCRDLARKTKLKKDADEAICRIRVLQDYF